MRIIVTGATGFVGRHLVHRLIEQQHTVVAVGRNSEKARALPWFRYVQFLPVTLGNLSTSIRKRLGDADLIVHLAWDGLPNYSGLFHFERNLPESYAFLRASVSEGYKRLLVIGTCLEYGMQDGCLFEAQDTRPVNPYGLAKDTLRKFLEHLAAEHTFSLQWCRLFYMHGEGQNPKSLMAQLDQAVVRGDDEFPMSGGAQIRDFLPVSESARRISILCEHSEASGIFNICSGKPISVHQLVNDRIEFLGSSIRPKLGVYPYPDYEPFAFWGDTSKYETTIRGLTNL